MAAQPLLLRTKVLPPAPQRRVLERPALAATLRQALEHRLTLVQAGTGYSKTTALAALDNEDARLFWYSIGEGEADPQRFLAYLIEAFRARLSNLSDLPLAALHECGGEDTREARERVVDALTNALAEALTGPSLLVLDDYHFVGDLPQISLLIERFITYLPPGLHVIVSTRYPPDWPSLIALRARGEVLDVTRAALAFRPDEIAALFQDVYGLHLSQEEISLLFEKTEGWPIALQLVRQGLRNEGQSVADLLRGGSPSLGALFSYLAHDVLGSQPPAIAAFLRDTAVLRELTPEACDAISGQGAGTSVGKHEPAANTASSKQLLNRLAELDLFVVALGHGHYRYHHLFHDFLLQQAQADPEGVRARHLGAARYFEVVGRHEEAIYHWLSARDFGSAAVAIERAGEEALRAGWLGTVTLWIDALPPEVLADRPALMSLLGDICRMQSRFDESLSWYAQAERLWRARQDLAGVSRALRGQALVYLDTVRPAQAEAFLEEALRLSDGLPDRQAHARLLDLLAENKLNMGKPDEAEELRASARTLREDGPGEDALSVRVKLRTGKLDEAQRILESWVAAERREVEHGAPHPPRAHRETLLLLSLIEAFRGDASRAFELAEEGIALGARLNSPFVTAVGHSRLGHAWQLRAGVDPLRGREAAFGEAVRCYNTAIALGDELSVRRVRAEAMWGLTRAYGFNGDLESAERACAEGVETGRWAGDAWIVALTELTLGASYVLCGQPERAAEVLQRVLAAFRECGDSFGRTATRLWLASAYHDLGQAELFMASLDDGLALCEAHGYGSLFKSPSLLGPPDPRSLVPLLLAARKSRSRISYVTRLLGEIGLSDAQSHPGYQLRVYTLGPFRVFRGGTEVEARDWQRDKARQLFQLLLTRRGRPLHREEIAEILWPSLSPEAAGRDFKVALNALNRAIEPSRHADAPTAFIEREGAAYRLRPGSDLWVDASAFEEGLRNADGVDVDIEVLQSVLALYQGNYLPDALYEDWASAERERLLSLYLRAADKLAGALVERGRYSEVIEVCERILQHDPCWESAYRWAMIAYEQQGDRQMALRVYGRCADNMKQELGIEPSPAVVALHERILNM